eukprot:PLAT3354.34.p1 GENE.PLAT3354.34~~PLAT3354.34.p1  ORF type:complete len:766 (-),score=342.49 PLAT3354.34:54-2237(-)
MRPAGAAVRGGRAGGSEAVTSGAALRAPSALSSRHAAALSTFVSSYYRVDEREVAQFLKRLGTAVRRSGDQLVIKECPFCPPTKGRADNLWKLYVRSTDGAFFCHRCGNKGSWFDFKNRLSGGARGGRGGARGGEDARPPAVSSAGDAMGRGGAPAAAEAKPVLDKEVAARLRAALLSGESPDALSYLKDVRGLSEEVLKLYGVGVTSMRWKDGADDSWKSGTAVSFPWVAQAGQFGLPAAADGGGDGSGGGSGGDGEQWQTVRVKLRALEDKAVQRLMPVGGHWGLFGWHTVPADAREIVITEGEYDAMAVHQATGLPAVSLPNGCRSLPVDILPALERFDSILLWMDNDVAGQEGAQAFVKKLGAARVKLVRPPVSGGDGAKDANDALLRGDDLAALLSAAAPMPHEQIATFTDLRDDVFRELSSGDELHGVPCKSLPALNALLKGHRKGELTILTGPTGMGKTTLLSQLSLDYASEGVNTLWGSFEVKNTRLLRTMLSQHCGADVETQLDDFDAIADDFAELPLYFMRFFGSSDIASVLDAMEHAVYVHDVQHILLDNLQFMLETGSGMDKFDVQDRALDAFRRFATKENVHLTLVIHPRKEPQGQALSVSSVFGSAKATQEADNVIILQNETFYKSVEVRKNRFDGELGSVPVGFDRPSRRFVQLSEAEVEAAKRQEAAVVDALRGGGGGGGRAGAGVRPAAARGMPAAMPTSPLPGSGIIVE